jgi:soluble lytic murein transglycosylase-like protein
MGVDNPHDFTQSAKGAAKYLSRLLKQYGGDARKASAAYNWGPGNVAKYGLGKAPKETRDYMDAVAGPAITQTNNITVNGVQDADKAARGVSRELADINATLVRQLKPRVQ